MSNYKDGVGNYKSTGGGGATVATQNVYKTATTTTNSTSYIDIPDMSIALPNNTGKSIIILIANVRNDTINGENTCAIYDGSDQKATRQVQEVAQKYNVVTICHIADNDGQTVKGRIKVNTGTVSIGGATTLYTSIHSFEVS